MKSSRPTMMFICMLICFLLFSWSTNANSENKAETNLCFLWAFGALVGPENDRRLVAITGDTTLNTGDQLKILLEVKNRCYVYLIYENPKHAIRLLFPYYPQQFVKDYRTSKRYYIPQGDRWFQLDENVGRETFHLLASNQRLVNLEAILESYASAEEGVKREYGKQVLAEIRNMKKRYRQFKSIAERPPEIVGRIRGDDQGEKIIKDDLADFAVKIKAEAFYSRTFAINHQ